MTPLTAEQLYVAAAALLADGSEGFVHHYGQAQIAGSRQRQQRDAPHPWHTRLRERTHLRDADGGTPPSRPEQGEALVLQAEGYQTILHGHAGGYRSHILARGRGTVWHGTARKGAFLHHVNWKQGPTQAYYQTMQGDAIRTTDVPDLHAGPITHARPAASLAVAQRGQQNPQWVVCMFSPGDAYIIVCNPKRLLGPEAVIRVADCARVIVKVLREGEHHVLLLQVRFKDNARAAKPAVWPAVARHADLELQLAVPTTVHHWLPAFHDLRWRGKPDSQISATHWQESLQADAKLTPSRVLDPRLRQQPSMHGPGPRAGAAHGSAGQPTLQLGARGRHPQVGAAPSGKGGHRTHEMPPMCGKVLHKRGNAGTPGVAHSARCWPSGRRRRPPTSSRGRHGDPYGMPRMPSAPPPKRPAARRPRWRKTRHPTRLRQRAVQPVRGPSPRKWPPRGPPWERAPHIPWPRHHPGTWLPQLTPRRCRHGTADSRRTRQATPSGSSPGTSATASSHRTGPSGTHSDDAGGRRPVPIRSTLLPVCCPRRGALPSC